MLRLSLCCRPWLGSNSRTDAESKAVALKAKWPLLRRSQAATTRFASAPVGRWLSLEGIHGIRFRAAPMRHRNYRHGREAAGLCSLDMGFPPHGKYI